MPLIKGDGGIVFSGYRRRYDPTLGWQVVSVYMTGSLTAAEAFGAAQATGGNTVDADLTAPPYRIEIASPGTEPGQNDDYSDRWEVLPISIEKPIEQHPVYLGLSFAYRDILRRYRRGELTYSDATGELNCNAGGTQCDLLDMFENNQTHFKSPATMVRWTRTVGDGYTVIGGTYTSVATIWSTATLLNLGPPTLYASAISQADSVLGTQADYTKGWLKEQPTITQRGNSRSDIVQEWTLENWSTLLYGTAI